MKPGRRHIAERFFCESEKELIRSLESFDDAADAMFFTLWTLKESFVKCTGEGLGRDLNSFTFEKTYDGSLSFLSKDKKETEKETENRPLSFLPFKLEGENRYRFVSFSDSSRIDGADMNKLDSEILSGPYIYSICYELADNIKNEDIKFEIHDVKK